MAESVSDASAPTDGPQVLMASGRERPSPSDQFAHTEKRVQADADLGEENGPTLFSVHHAHAILNDRAVLSQPIDRAPQSAAGRHDVLDEQHEIASVQFPFEVVPRAVLLRGLAHDHVRRVAREADGGGDRNGTEFDPRDWLAPRTYGAIASAIVRRRSGRVIALLIST